MIGMDRERLVRCFARMVVAAAVFGSPSLARAQADTMPVVARGGVLAGTVRDSLGGTVAGARVSAGDAQAITDSSGAFSLRGLAPGVVTLSVRRLGFEPLQSRVVLGDAPRAVDLRIRPIGELLPVVRVNARAEPYASRLAGFYDRRARKVGYYISRDEIERRNDFDLTSALRKIPGVRPYTMRGALGRSVRLPGSNCPPLVFVDGFPAALGSFDLDMIDLAGVEGIEVYLHGGAMPPEFAGPFGSEGCGVIAIWSLPARPRRQASRSHTPPPDVGALVETGEVFLPDRVDVQARLIGGTARASYPDSLLRAGVAGRVVAQVVVDTAGDVESGTLAIISSNHPMFASAVRAVMPEAKFEPARRQGHVVRELISIPFEFDPKVPASSPPPSQPGQAQERNQPPSV